MAEPIPLRPRGAPTPRRTGLRGKALPRAFLDDLAADWQAHGAQTIPRARLADPVSYLRIVGALVQHLTPRPPQEPPPPPPNPFEGMFRPPPPPDAMASRLTAALQALLPCRAADFSDAELVERWGVELAEYYFTKVRVRRPE